MGKQRDVPGPINHGSTMKHSLAEGHLSLIICTAWYHPIPLLGAPHPTRTTSHCLSPAAATMMWYVLIRIGVPLFVKVLSTDRNYDDHKPFILGDERSRTENPIKIFLDNMRAFFTNFRNSWNNARQDMVAKGGKKENIFFGNPDPLNQSTTTKIIDKNTRISKVPALRKWEPSN